MSFHTYYRSKHKADFFKVNRLIILILVVILI